MEANEGRDLRDKNTVKAVMRKKGSFCNIELSGMEVSIINAMSRETIIKRYVGQMREFKRYHSMNIWAAREMALR